MRYFAKITKQPEGGYLVVFPELSGCVTEGETLKEAQANAKELLDGWLSVICTQAKPLDSISVPKLRRGKDFYPIEVDALVARAVVLKLLRAACELSTADAATLVGMKLDEYNDFEVPLVVDSSTHTLSVFRAGSKHLATKKRKRA